jgi:hypothetical protein
MIDNSEINSIADQCGASYFEFGEGEFAFPGAGLVAFAKHFYKKGRDEQRDKDANICESTDNENNCDGTPRMHNYVCADAIRNASPESDIDQTTRTT